ncbi:MAG: PAS domain S-box protein [Desulfohalobiaceae bacterium]
MLAARLDFCTKGCFYRRSLYVPGSPRPGWGRRFGIADSAPIDTFFESRHKRKDGTIIDVEVSLSGERIARQNVLIGICRDISERKQTEKRLEEEFSLRNALLDNIPHCVALILKKGTRPGGVALWLAERRKGREGTGGRA